MHPMTEMALCLAASEQIAATRRAAPMRPANRVQVHIIERNVRKGRDAGHGIIGTVLMPCGRYVVGQA